MSRLCLLRLRSDELFSFFFIANFIITPSIAIFSNRENCLPIKRLSWNRFGSIGSRRWIISWTFLTWLSSVPSPSGAILDILIFIILGSKIRYLETFIILGQFVTHSETSIVGSRSPEIRNEDNIR